LSFIIGLIYLIILFIAGCSENTEQTIDVSNERLADRIMYDAEFEFTEKGEATAILKAERLLFFDKENKVFGYNIVVDFFDKNQKKAGQLEADSGMVVQSTRQATVYGNVYLITNDNTELWSDSLSYYPDIERIKTGAPVVIERENDHISGVGLNSDLNFEDIRIESNVSGKLSDY